jgi:glycosyltransferase involved in cell wall biosynthesis
MSPLPPPTGGISTWTLAVLASELREHWELRVVDTSPSQKERVHGESRLRADRIVDALRILAKLIVELVRFRPDVIHINTPLYWAFLRDGTALWLASLFGARTVIHPHRGDLPEFVGRARQPLRRFIDATLRHADCCIALSDDNRRLLEESVGPNKVRFVPNFVSLEDLAQPPDRSERTSGLVEVLFVGWILESKGVRELLAAAKNLPSARFTLVGPPQPDFVETVRRDLDALGDRVRLLSPRPREEILELYRGADVFTLPSHTEGFPMVILEAMAAALPVVATSVGAIPHILEDGEQGLLIPQGDAEALETALRRLVESPQLRRNLGQQARQRVEAAFTPEAVIRQLDGIYRALLEL